MNCNKVEPFKLALTFTRIQFIWYIIIALNCHIVSLPVKYTTIDLHPYTTEFTNNYWKRRYELIYLFMIIDLMICIASSCYRYNNY